MGINNSLLKSIQTIVDKAINGASYDRTRQAQVVFNNNDGTYIIRIDSMTYNNVPSYPITPYIDIGDIVKIVIPSNQHSQMYIEPNMQTLLRTTYPVGCYYWTSDENFLPAKIFGGEWEKIDPGVMLVSAGTGYTVRSGTAKDGGSEYIQAHTHGFTNPSLPNHTHGFTQPKIPAHTHNMGTNRQFVTRSNHADGVGEKGVTSGTAFYVPSINKSDNWYGAENTASSGGGGACTGGAVNNPSSNPACTGGSVNAVAGLPSGQTTGDQGNMPPFKCAYCWHRIG